MANQNRCQHDKGEGRICNKLASKGQTRCREHQPAGETRMSETPETGPKQDPMRQAMTSAISKIHDDERQRLQMRVEEQEAAILKQFEQEKKEVQEALAAQPPPVEDIEKRAMREAYPKMVADKLTLEKRTALRLSKKGKGQKLPPAKLQLYVPGRIDMAEVPAHLREDGMYYRFVSLKGADGRPSGMNLARWTAEVQAEVVYDGALPYKNELGVLTKCPASNWAANAIDKSSRGAFDSNEQVRELEDELRRISRSSGGHDVAEIIRGEGHGEREEIRVAGKMG